MMESVSACGCACTAASTASRGRVTRRGAPRSMRSRSEVGGTLRSMLRFLERIKKAWEAKPPRDHACPPLRRDSAGGAGDENRTRVASLEDWGSTIELH